MKYLFTFFMSGAMISLGFAQEQRFSLGGLLMDEEANTPLAAATVQLFHLPDSSVLNTSTNERGLFRFTALKEGVYFLKISFVGYESYEKEIELLENIRLGQIRLKVSQQLLKDVEVRDRMPRAIQKGDTTEFNAQAYKTQPDASAEDLIRKLPGVVITNGTVQAQGEDVKEVLVDGKPFFGNDPTAALKNLPAEVIDKIQVFDKQSDQAEFTGFDDGQSSKTINIITRTDKRNGEFGKVYASYGLNNRYALGGSINVFNGDQRFSMIGQSNNINIQNFATEDLLGVIGSGGQGRRRGGGGPRGGGGGRRGGGPPVGGFGAGSASDFLVGQQSGISNTNAVGFNYSDSWGEKLNVTGSYFFNNSQNSADQSLSRETFLTADSSQFYDEKSLSESNNYNHRFNIRMLYTLDEKNSIIYQPSMSWQHNIGNEFTEGISSLKNGRLLNTTLNDYKADLTGLNFSNSLLFRHSFEKRGRSLSLRLNAQINQQQGQNKLLAENIYYTDVSFTTDTLDQYSTLDKYDRTYAANLTYTEPLGDKLSLMFNYDASLKQGKSDKFTNDFNETDNAYSLIDSALSNQFESQYVTHAAGTGVRYNLGKLSFSARINYQLANLNNDQYYPAEGQINRTFESALPSAMLHYRMEGGKNLRVFYRTSTNAPDVSDLQKVIDNSNPLMLIQGNPALEQSYQHNLFGRFASTYVDKASSFFILLGGSYTQNYVGKSTIIAMQDTLINNVLLQQGAQLERPVNLDNSWNLRSFISYGIPVSALKSNLNFNTSVNYSHAPGLISDQINHANNLGLDMGVVLSSNISQQIDFTISSRSSYNLVHNSLQAELNNNYFNQNTELKFHGRTEYGLFVETDMNHQYYAGLSDAYNQSYWLLNLSVGKKIFKNQLGELKLSVFDLLNQNTTINRTVSETYIEDVRTAVLQRFALLTLSYNLRNFRL